MFRRDKGCAFKTKKQKKGTGSYHVGIPVYSRGIVLDKINDLLQCLFHTFCTLFYCICTFFTLCASQFDISITKVFIKVRHCQCGKLKLTQFI